MLEMYWELEGRLEIYVSHLQLEKILIFQGHAMKTCADLGKLVPTNVVNSELEVPIV